MGKKQILIRTFSGSGLGLARALLGLRAPHRALVRIDIRHPLIYASNHSRTSLFTDYIMV